jgi:hypothetical protein
LEFINLLQQLWNYIYFDYEQQEEELFEAMMVMWGLLQGLELLVMIAIRELELEIAIVFL